MAVRSGPPTPIMISTFGIIVGLFVPLAIFGLFSAGSGVLGLLLMAFLQLGVSQAIYTFWKFDSFEQMGLIEND